MSDRYAEYLDGRLEMHLKESACVECGVKNDNAHQLCVDCQGEI